jgi:hypothetical protein
VAGVNFKVENHRKRLRYIENLDTATANTPIVIAVKKAEVDIEGLKNSIRMKTPHTTLIKEIQEQAPQPDNAPPPTDNTQPPANTTLSKAKAELRTLIQTRSKLAAPCEVQQSVGKKSLDTTQT